jgi:hypothetical protein
MTTDLGGTLDHSKHQYPDQPAERSDQPPVPEELSARRLIGCLNPRLGRETAQAVRFFADREVPNSLGEPGLSKPDEIGGVDLQYPAGWLPGLPNNTDDEFLWR